MERQNIKDFSKNIYHAWRVFIWVLRWVSIVLFGVLFFIGIYFRLPWKALACIAVIPLVGIFVPKKIQPWVWGSITVLIVAMWGWVHLPEKNTGNWQPYEYSDELDLIERDYFPPGLENAADTYSAVLEEHGETIFFFNYPNLQAEQDTLASPWDPNTYPFLDFWLTKLDNAVDQLIAASRLDECRFEIPHTLEAVNPQMQRINQIKGWSRILQRSANRDLFLGNQERALEKLTTLPRIAGHLYQQQTLFDQAAAFHIELMGARSLETFLIDHCNDPELMADIENLYAELDPQWAGNWPDILLREKLTAKNLAGLMYEVNDEGRIRISHNAMMALQQGLGYRPQRLFLNQHEMNRLAVIGLWLALPASPQRLADIVDDRFDYYSLQVQKGEDIPNYPLKYIWIKGLNVKTVIDWLAMQRVGYFWALDGQFKRHLAIVKQIRIFTALKRYSLAHQQWPESLKELDIEDAAYVLTDPLCGKPFVYEQTVQGFRLYSLGPNGIDDEGENDPKENKDDILLWPRTDEMEEWKESTMPVTPGDLD